MASTNHTSNYTLPPWVATDAFKREDFNDAFSKIDTQIKSAKDNASAAVANGVKIATGTYTGTGQHGSSHKNTLTFQFAPKLVFIKHYSDATPFGFFYPGQSEAGYNVSSSSSNSLEISWSNGGKTLSWYHYQYESYQFNDSGEKYFYLAIG